MTDMKNGAQHRVLFPLAAATLAAALALTGCSSTSSSFGVVSTPDNRVEVTAENAEGSAATGNLSLAQGELLVAESGLSKGAVTVRLVPEGQQENAQAAFEQEFSGSGTAEYEVAAGDYDVYCEVTQKGATGTLNLSVKAAPQQEEPAGAEAGADAAAGADVAADAGQGEAVSGETVDWLQVPEDQQKEIIAEYVGTAPENLVFIDTGMIDDTDPIAIFAYVDDEGNEADVRILLFDDGSVAGFTPENEVIDLKNYFAQ